MDLGIFLSSKKKLLIWIVTPLVVICILYIPSLTHFKSVNNKLSEKKFMLESMPAIIEKIALAQSMVKGYQSDSSRTEIIEWLNSQFGQVASVCNLAIDSLVVEKSDSTQNSSLTVYKISIKAEGQLSKIISFFEDSKTLMPLLTLDSVQLRAMGEYNTDRIYNAQISLSYGSLM